MTLILGLTGSIGMGKSTVAAMFARLRVPVFDADAEVRRMQGPGGALIDAIEALHPGTTGVAGVDRSLLGEATFGRPDALRRLERLVHPAVRRAERAFVRRHRAHRLVLLDIPLLFERGGWRRVQFTAVVSAPAWKQRRRALARPGMTPAKLERIRALQLPDHRKRLQADVVIPTGGTLGRTRAAVRRITACLRARARR
jgi:dephospho-CoA kinase